MSQYGVDLSSGVPPLRPARQRSPYFWLGIVALIVGGLVTLCLGLFAALGVFLAVKGPPDQPIPGNELPAKHGERLVELGLVPDAGKVLYFYSEAMLDLDESVAFFTAQELVYHSNENNPPTARLPLIEVDYVDFEKGGGGVFGGGVLRAHTIDHTGCVHFELPTLNNGYLGFQRALDAAIEAERARFSTANSIARQSVRPADPATMERPVAIELSLAPTEEQWMRSDDFMDSPYYWQLDLEVANKGTESCRVLAVMQETWSESSLEYVRVHTWEGEELRYLLPEESADAALLAAGESIDLRIILESDELDHPPVRYTVTLEDAAGERQLAMASIAPPNIVIERNTLERVRSLTDGIRIDNKPRAMQGVYDADSENYQWHMDITFAPLAGELTITDYGIHQKTADGWENFDTRLNTAWSLAQESDDGTAVITPDAPLTLSEFPIWHQKPDALDLLMYVVAVDGEGREYAGIKEFNLPAAK